MTNARIAVPILSARNAVTAVTGELQTRVEKSYGYYNEKMEY